MYDSVMTAKIENYHLPITKMLRKFSLLCHTDKGCRAIPIVHFLTSFRVWGGVEPMFKRKFHFGEFDKVRQKSCHQMFKAKGGFLKLQKWYHAGFPKVFRLLILNRGEDSNVCKNKRGKEYYYC